MVVDHLKKYSPGSNNIVPYEQKFQGDPLTTCFLNEMFILGYGPLVSRSWDLVLQKEKKKKTDLLGASKIFGGRTEQPFGGSFSPLTVDCLERKE